MTVDYGFVFINDIAFPYPSNESGLQTIATFVDSARNISGVITSEKIGRDNSKVEMTWRVLPRDVWATMLREFDKFTFRIRYIDMKTDNWITRTFYVGDRTAQPFKINKSTNRPEFYLNCKANVIDTGR